MNDTFRSIYLYPVTNITFQVTVMNLVEGVDGRVGERIVRHDAGVGDQLLVARPAALEIERHETCRVCSPPI